MVTPIVGRTDGTRPERRTLTRRRLGPRRQRRCAPERSRDWSSRRPRLSVPSESCRRSSVYYPTMSRKIVDRTGQRFGKLMVTRAAGRDRKGCTTFHCQCDCGGTVIASGWRLASGGRESCGCLQKERVKADRASKRCARCRTVKPIDAFARRKHSKDGHGCYCVPCQREQTRTEGSRRSRPDQAQYKSKRYKADPSFRLACQLRCRITKVMKGGKRCLPIKDIVGCTLEHLKAHLESLWTEGMTWSNHGKTGWHIDHIRPCASFDLTDPEQQKACFHWSNLQPLWAVDNFRKSARWSPNGQS